MQRDWVQDIQPVGCPLSNKLFHVHRAVNLRHTITIMLWPGQMCPGLSLAISPPLSSSSGIKHTKLLSPWPESRFCPHHHAHTPGHSIPGKSSNLGSKNQGKVGHSRRMVIPLMAGQTVGPLLLEAGCSWPPTKRGCEKTFRVWIPSIILPKVCPG